MNKHISHLSLIPCIPFLLLSCTSNRENLMLTLVFDQAIEGDKYPAFVNDMVPPFEDPECETDFLLKPINFVRADIKRTEMESNAWHFENIGDNTVEFSKGWLQQYFTDSLPTSYLKQAKGDRNVDLTSYLNKEDEVVLIYSEESELDEYEGNPIYHTAKEVHDKIEETACGNLAKKVVVLINPSSLQGPKPISYPSDPCGTQSLADAADLKLAIRSIINLDQSDESRINKAEKVWEDFFDSKAYVASYKRKEDNNPDVYNPGEGKQYFTNKLAVLESIHDIAIFRIETSQKSGKISGIHIVECHDAKEIL